MYDNITKNAVRIEFLHLFSPVNIEKDKLSVFFGLVQLFENF